MSMDLEVWSPRAFAFPDDLPDPGSWSGHATEFALSGDGWHILVLPADDSPPADVRAKLKDAAAVAYVTLEPIGAPDEAYRRLETVVRHLARVSGGVWVDPQGEPHRHDEGDW
jgi:hypothetical protein